MAKDQVKAGGAASAIVKQIPFACADEGAAVELLEQLRWRGSPACPCCGSVGVYQMRDKTGAQRERNFRWRCRDCGERYTVRTGTVMADSRLPLRHWCYAFWAACASKKGVSAKQIQRQTGLSYKSALFLMHRVRFAMSPGAAPKMTGTVEVDETYVGGKPRGPKWNRGTNKQSRAKFSTRTRVVAMVERGGNVRAEVSQGVTARNIRTIVLSEIDRSATLMTDEYGAYRTVGKMFAGHGVVRHSVGEYARGDANTNTIESFFGLVKRGMYGTFHAVSKRHLHRYVDEFAFRWNTRGCEDGERTAMAIRGGEGKKLLYRQPEAA